MGDIYDVLRDQRPRPPTEKSLEGEVSRGDVVSSEKVAELRCAKVGCDGEVVGVRFGSYWCYSHQPLYDAVERPRHYAASEVETIDAIEAWGWGPAFHLGNVVKYLSRAGKKDGSSLLEDLKKARWYLERAIAFVEKGGGR